LFLFYFLRYSPLPILHLLFLLPSGLQET
jgi:hypothetical protein